MQDFTRSPAAMDMLCAGISNVCPICRYFRDIHSRNVHDLDLDLWNGLPSNLDILMERPRAISQLITIAMIGICHHFRDIHCRNVDGLDIDLQNWLRSSLKMLTLTLKFRERAKVKSKCANRKATCDIPCVCSWLGLSVTFGEITNVMFCYNL